MSHARLSRPSFIRRNANKLLSGVSTNANKLLPGAGAVGFLGSLATLSHNYLQTIQEGMSDATRSAAAICVGSLVTLAYAARNSRPQEATWSVVDPLSILPIAAPEHSALTSNTLLLPTLATKPFMPSVAEYTAPPAARATVFDVIGKDGSRVPVLAA